VRCAHAPTLLHRTAAGARKLLQRAGCKARLRVVRLRGAGRAPKVVSQVPAPRGPMRADRRVVVRVR
jgi:hypothetical protein